MSTWRRAGAPDEHAMAHASLPAPPEPSDPVAGGALAGTLVGLLVGLPVAAATTNVAMPTVVPLLAALAGTVVGALIGLRAERRRAPAPAPPPPLPRREVSETTRLLGAQPPSTSTDPDAVLPGWHPDPVGDGGLRFWDGEQWTRHLWRRRAS